MTTQVRTGSNISLEKVPRASSIAVIVLGCMVLVGWQFDIAVLKSISPGLATMKANSALGFILCGISLWSLNYKPNKKSIRLLGTTCAAIAALIGGLTLGEYVFNLDFGIDQLLFQDHADASAGFFPGRMSPATALIFLLLGSVLLLIDSRWSNWLNETFSITALVIAGVAVVGRLYDVASLHQIGVYASMALHTALGFILLCLGVLCVRPEHTVVSTFTNDSPAGILARRLLPAAIGLPIVLGWLILSGQRMGYYDSAFGIALFALSNVIIFSLLIWQNTNVLYQAETERGQAQRALSLSEKRAQALIENSWDAIALFGADGTILYGSPSTPQILGYALDEFVGRNAFELIHQEDQALVTERMKLSLQRPREHISVYARARHKNGEWRWLEGVFTNLLDEPSVQAIVNNYHDFTERKQVEEKLHENEERYSRFFENMHEIFVVQEVITDNDGKPIDLRFVDVNPAAERFLGRTRNDIVGRTRSQLSGQSDPEGVEMASRVASTGEPFHMVRYSAGFGSWFESFTYSLGSGMVATLSLNVTERKEAETTLQRMNEELERQVQERTLALSQANSLLQMLLDQMPDHIYFKDAQSRFIRNSRSQAKALGLSDPAEAVGKSDFDFFPHAQQSFEIEQEIIRSGKPLVDQEERVLWPDGTETWVSTTKAPLLDQAGHIIGTFGISRDITERKRGEVALQKAKLELEAANKELEAFSYSVSHDLRAPLRSVDGFSQALLEDYGELLPPEGRNFLDRIRSSAQRMAQLIDDLLDLSRVTRVLIKSVPVDLTKLAENVTAELQRTYPERRVKLRIAPNLNVRGDPHLLQVVLENFLSNAWKFTSKQELAEIEFGSKHENNETIYFVRDNGAGFDMTYASKLFGAFQRLHAMTEFPGTGVGLATVQRIIHRHGGRVWAESAVGQGATFFFTLPPLERVQSQAEPQEKDSLATRIKEII